jgi:Tol biopolymer transport system component
MALPKGARLGPYEIQDALGAGGMGEVYRARDTRLDRTVAIKVLPEHLAANPELRQRLEREARAVSSLSHPNVCALYDLGHDQGVDFLVMEYLEGESLAARLAKGPLPTDELLRIAVPIADALEKAHRSGIIHRDLKPGNIMLTRGGAKLLDFGLAKADSLIGGDLGGSPTISQPLTTAGTILGTYQYMAPEQLEGAEVDARTDIYAFGAVLYEMATGRRAFQGSSPASLIGAIMHSKPQPASTIQPMTPPALDRVIETCLAKDPDARWQTAHDVKLQLEWIAEGGSQVGLPAPVTARRKSRERLAWAVAALAATAAVALGVGFAMRAPAAPRQFRFEIAAPEGMALVDSPRISPDGRLIAFRATDAGGKTAIWLRSLDNLEARPLAGTDNAQEGRPIWSPDSRRIAFFVGGKLKKVSVEGGPAQTICDAPTGADGSWGAAGQILYDGGGGDPIRAVAEGGGSPRDVITATSSGGGANSVGWPEFLPDGERFVFLEAGSGGGLRLMLGDLDGTAPTTLVESDSRAQYVEPGYLLYVRESTLVAQPFDAGTGELRGDPRPLADKVDASNVGQADFSVSRDGILVYRSLTTDVRQLLWRDRAGRELGTVGEVDWFGAPSVSAHESRLAIDTYDEQSDQRDVWIYDLERGSKSRLTFDPGLDINPLWSPDRARIAFSSNRSGSFDLYLKDASGAGDEQRLLTAGEDLQPCDWSRDGRHILFMRRGADTSWDVWALPMDGSGDAFPLVQTTFSDSRPSFSPDGRWFAYESDESGRSEIYVRQFPGPGGRWQVSTAGGSEPVWSADGREIFYLDAGEKLLAVAVRTADAFTAALPETLFEARLFQRVQRNRYAAASSGDRFLMVSPLESQTIPAMTVVLNWDATLAQ